MGADYLLAPPGSSSSVATAVAPAGAPAPADVGVARFAPRLATSDVAASGGPAVGAPTYTAAVVTAADSRAVAVASASSAAPERLDGQAALVASIQTELRRVGCYSGESTGRWSDQTRTAMNAFNSSVRVSLPTAQPDYILLTLLQGHSAKACADRTLEARAVAPALATAAAGAAIRQQGPPAKSWVSEVASAPIVVVPEKGAPRIAAPGYRPLKIGGAAPPPSPSDRADAGLDGASAARHVALSGDADASRPLPQASPPRPPFDGRMAVGAPPVLVMEPVRAQPPRRDEYEAPARRTREPTRRSRVQRMFTDLGSYAP